MKLILSYQKLCRKVLTVICYVAITILLTILFKVTLFEAYVIATPSMEPALMAGDKVIVNKLILGGRFFRNFYAVFGRGELPKISRIPGLRGVNRNDVLIFNYPYNDWETMKHNSNWSKEQSYYYAKASLTATLTMADTIGRCSTSDHSISHAKAILYPLIQ